MQTRERNRACRIAYGHARRGDVKLTERWLTIAAEFAAPTEQQIAHVERLLREANVVIPGQFNIFGREEGVDDMERAAELWDAHTLIGPEDDDQDDERPDDDDDYVIVQEADTPDFDAIGKEHNEWPQPAKRDA